MPVDEAGEAMPVDEADYTSVFVQTEEDKVRSVCGC